MDVFSVVVIVLLVFISHSCNAQVKNSSLPLVMWHGMGMLFNCHAPAEDGH